MDISFIHDCFEAICKKEFPKNFLVLLKSNGVGSGSTNSALSLRGGGRGFEDYLIFEYTNM